MERAIRQAYLERLGYTGPIVPAAEVLCRLHTLHMQMIPFENLDIAAGIPIVLNVTAILNKIVERRRGGFCYELNSAFGMLLQDLGFTVRLLSARMPRADGTLSPEFDHLALRVETPDDGVWLADVGFGDCFSEPLPFSLLNCPAREGDEFRMRIADGDHCVERRMDGGQWKTEYQFSLDSRNLEDFAEMCRFHQTSPASHFTRNSICTLATTRGRVTVSASSLILTENGTRTETAFESELEREEALWRYFGIRAEHKTEAASGTLPVGTFEQR